MHFDTIGRPIFCCCERLSVVNAEHRWSWPISDTWRAIKWRRSAFDPQSALWNPKVPLWAFQSAFESAYKVRIKCVQSAYRPSLCFWFPIKVRNKNPLVAWKVCTSPNQARIRHEITKERLKTLCWLAGIMSQLCAREKQKSEKITKQNKTKQNGNYDIKYKGTASPSPSLWQALEKTGCAPLLCEWREVLSHC